MMLTTLPTQTDGFAAWFVDRRVSCFTPLAADEIIMNAAVLPHSQSREPNIRIEVSPLDSSKEDTAQPDSEYMVKFILQKDESGNLAYHLSDVQYVFELVGENPVAKFTSAPTNGGGIGCEGKRSFGAVKGKDSADGSNTAAIFTINHDATIGAGLEIVAGWATGHSAVTLTEKVTLFVGQGVAATNDGTTGGDDDDALQDDQAEVELEEAYIEEEREEFNQVMDYAEGDAVTALEEKRRELDESESSESKITEADIKEAEEKVVEVMEANRQHVNEALDSVRDAIKADFVDRLQNGNRRKRGNNHNQRHDADHRREAQRDHREKHELKFKNKEGRLEEMRRHFSNHNVNVDDVPKNRLNVLMNIKDSMKDSFQKLHLMDKNEHDRARKERIQLPEAELQLDVEALKRKAQEKLHVLSDKLVGVHEMMNDSPRMREIRNKLKQGQMRGGEGLYHGDVGKPLPPEGRHFLIVMFSLFGLVGLIRWYLEKRRRSRVNKGRRDL